MAAVVRPTRIMVNSKKPSARNGRNLLLVLLKIKTPFKSAKDRREAGIKREGEFLQTDVHRNSIIKHYNISFQNLHPVKR